MANDATRFFADLSRIAGICQDCEQIFRLSDARPYRMTPTMERAQALVDLQFSETLEPEAGVREATPRVPKRKRGRPLNPTVSSPTAHKSAFDVLMHDFYDTQAMGPGSEEEKAVFLLARHLKDRV